MSRKFFHASSSHEKHIFTKFVFIFFIHEWPNNLGRIDEISLDSWPIFNTIVKFFDAVFWKKLPAAKQEVKFPFLILYLLNGLEHISDFAIDAANDQYSNFHLFF